MDKEKRTIKKELSSEEIVELIIKSFNDIASYAISLSDKELQDQAFSTDLNNAIRRDIDSIEEHDPEWHMYGIKSHSIMVYKKYLEFLESPNLLFKELRIDFLSVYNDWASQEIHGRSKAELTKYADLLHDIGKWQRSVSKEDEHIRLTAQGHEIKSADLILDENGPVYKLLTEKCKLKEEQIKYIADCVRSHYELGKIRHALADTTEGATIQGTKSQTFRTECKKIITQYEEYSFEIGLFFILDSVSKIDTLLDDNGKTVTLPTSDAEIYNPAGQWQRAITSSGYADKPVKKAYEQLPINLSIGREYLRILVEEV